MIIVDAGGGTIDLSAYRKVNSGAYQEIAATQCLPFSRILPYFADMIL